MNRSTEKGAIIPSNEAGPEASAAWRQAEVRPGTPAEIAAAAELVTAAMTLARRQLALTQLADTLRRSGPQGVVLAVAPRTADPARLAPQTPDAAPLVAAAMATRSSSDAGLLVGVGHLGSPDDRITAARLAATVDCLHRQLAAQGVSFVQATWKVDDADPPFAAFGYHRIADLDYLACPVADLLTPAALPPAAEVSDAPDQPLDPTASADNRRRWIELLEQTFQGTLDCPLLSQFRSSADIVASYINAPEFDPSLWRVIRQADQEIAGLILTPHRDGAIMELTYMGVIAAQRGRGWGGRLATLAARMATDRGAEEIMLAVDRQNTPATTLYHRRGFESLASEAVWARALTHFNKRPQGSSY